MSNTAIIVGAGSGFGRRAALTIADQGWRAVAIARSAQPLESLAGDASGEVVPVVGDGRDGELARKLLAEHSPTAVLVGGGASPHMAPLHHQSWETLSIHWEADVALAFTWLKAVLDEPPARLRRVVVLSSGAALSGSPGSGGYAGAKAAVQHLTAASAVQSAQMLDLPITFTAVLPQLTHDTDLGRSAVEGYAAMSGRSAEDAVATPPPYTADFAGRRLASLLTDDDTESGALMLTADGLSPVERDEK